MKRLSFMLALLCAYAVPALAQIQGGSITGVIKDEQGGVLPGVTVTVQGVDATQTFVTETTGEFRFLNLAPGPYKVTATLRVSRPSSARTSSLRRQERRSADDAEDRAGRRNDHRQRRSRRSSITKATGTSTNFTANELTKIPTSRDPFALMRSVPGVLVDRVNIGGNETGQQSQLRVEGHAAAGRGLDDGRRQHHRHGGRRARRRRYFNYDNFEEIQVSTAGQDIKQPTGGIGPEPRRQARHQPVPRRRPRLLRQPTRWSRQRAGRTRGARRHARHRPITTSRSPTTASTSADRSCSDKAWFYGSYSLQDVRLVRRAGALVDRTQLKNPNVKLNWQATKKDMVSFLYFDGFKIKDGRSPGIVGHPVRRADRHAITRTTPTRTTRCTACGRSPTIASFSSNMFVSAKYAYFNTGFVLDPVGGLDQQAGRRLHRPAQSFGSVNQSLNVRPQKIANIDANNFLTGLGGSTI